MIPTVLISGLFFHKGLVIEVKEGRSKATVYVRSTQAVFIMQAREEGEDPSL